MINIIPYNQKDINAFISLCKKEFLVHNIFGQQSHKIAQYIFKLNKSNFPIGGFYFAYENNSLVGGGLLRIEQKELSGKHFRYKYNHIVGINDEVKSQIITFFENKISRDIKSGKLKTAKIEVGLPENEAEFALYKKLGYKLEGKLSDHYRYHEDTFMFGKSIE